MHFISQVLVPCVLFIAFVVQTVGNDYNVIGTLVPFVPLILSAVASTYLVRHIILSQHSTGVFSHDRSPDHVNWASSSALPTTIDWQENSPLNPASSKTTAFDNLKSTVRNLLTIFNTPCSGVQFPAQPETPPNTSTRPSAPPSGPPASKPENDDDIRADAEGRAEFQATAIVQARTRTAAKTDGRHKRVAGGAQSTTPAQTTTARPYINSNTLKQKVDLLRHYLAKSTFSVPTSANGRARDQARSTPRRGRTSTPTPTPTLRDRSPTRVNRHNRKLAFEKTVKRTHVGTVLETEEEPEIPPVPTNRPRRPWFGRPVRVHVGFREEVTVRDLPMMKWDVMARRKFRSWTRERRLEAEYKHWAPLLWLDEEEDKEIPLRPDDRPRLVNKKYKGRINLEFELVPMYELEEGQEPNFNAALVPEKEPEPGSEKESGPEEAPFLGFASATEILSQDGELRDEIKSRGEWEPEPEPQGHWAGPALQGNSGAPAEVQQSAGLRRILRKLSPVRAVNRLFKN
ncbi:hypothetical protein FRC01_005097 [Tulasnella sp. 417]|nr:hypothetical protein FRC01_005097 [Tulasnella sp. 417]